MIEPTVSAFIACKDHGTFVGDAIESLMLQTMKPSQLILINDGSRDHTDKVFLDFKKRYPDTIQIITHKQNLGNIRSYNEGIDKCRGKYIHLMAADDVIYNIHFYEDSVIKMEQDEEIAFCSLGLNHMDETGKVLSPTPVIAPKTEKVSAHDALSLLKTHGNFINGGGVLIRKTSQHKAGWYDPDLPFSADFANWIKVFKNGNAAYFWPLAGYGYRIHNGQMTSQKKVPDLERKKIKLLFES